MQWKCRSHVDQHFSCNCEIVLQFVLSYLVACWLKRRLKQDRRHLPLRVVWQSCSVAVLIFHHFSMHCRRGLINCCFREVKRFFSLAFRDVRINRLPLYREEGMGLGMVQVCKVSRTLGHTKEPRKWDWVSESRKCPSVLWMGGLLWKIPLTKSKSFRWCMLETFVWFYQYGRVIYSIWLFSQMGVAWVCSR